MIIKFEINICRYRVKDLHEDSEIFEDLEYVLGTKRNRFDSFMVETNGEFERDDISFDSDSLISILQLKIGNKTRLVFIPFFLNFNPK